MKWDVVFYYRGERYASKAGGVESPTQSGALSSTIASWFPGRQVGLIYNIIHDQGGRWHARPAVAVGQGASKAKEAGKPVSPDMLPDADGTADPPWPARRRSRPA